MTGRVCTVIALMFIASTAIASQEQRYTDNVNWAKQSATVTQGQSGFTAFSVNEYCKDTTCQQQLSNPEQTRYRNDATAMDSAKTAAIATDDNAQAVTTNFNKGRPTIDPNDPTWAIVVGIQNNAYNISHGLSDKYTDCSGNGKRCITETTYHTCQTLRTEPLTCYESSQYNSYYDRTVSRTYGSNYLANKRSTTLPALPAKAVALSSITITSSVTQDRGYTGGCTTTELGNIENVNLTLRISGRHYAIKGEQYCTNYRDGRDYRKGWTNPAVSAQTIAINRKITGKITIAWPFKTREYQNASIRLNFIERHVSTRWTNSCSQNPAAASCGLTKNQCIEGAGTRTIKGVPVYQSCWKYKKTYQCGQGEVNTCGQYQSCKQTQSRCAKTVNGQCIKWNKKYTCDVETCDNTTLICGEQSFCLDGECYNPTREKNTEFDQAASSLAALADAAKGLGDPPLLFTGKAMTCSKKPVGLSDCCKDSGWGNDIGLAQCSDEEKALVEAKKNKLTISLGQYCAEKVLGVCIRKKKAYCTYDSKLARIVQEQGKPQLGMNFGSAKHPDCSAITPEQMQQMDFSNMDFSDFYNDLHNNMTLPDNNQIQQRIKDALGGKK
jgi:conjugal transfer mating pair stabilization protein TraN